MLSSKFTKLTTGMIYSGTLLLSILSFFTTYYGMCLLLHPKLALIGSLGLQAAMLGIAWNLIKVRDKRFTYTSVFMVAAAFSIFFSYANFDSALTENTRSTSMRSTYIEAVRPTLTSYAALTNDALTKGRYQVERLAKLIELEETKGWTTIIDEGSKDPFIQNVIDGSRLTIDSWKKITNKKYNQGSGRGIIVDYMESRLTQAKDNLQRVSAFKGKLESLSLAFGVDMSVEDQYQLVNTAWVAFPTSEIALITSGEKTVSPPPNPTEFAETPKNPQHAFLLAINDLLTLTPMAIFSFLLAFAIDFIVVLMALAGSYRIEDTNDLLFCIKQDASKRINRLSMDSIDELSSTLDDNMKKLKVTGNYGLKYTEVYKNFLNSDSLKSVTLHLPPESAVPEKTVVQEEIAEFR